MRAWLVCFACAACGRIGFAPRDPGVSDAFGVDARVCGAWGAPERLDALVSGMNDYGPSLSTDRLTLYLHSNRTASYDIFTATRPTTDAAFGAPSPVTELSDPTEQDSNVALSADGLELYLESTIGGLDKCIYSTTRSSLTAPWNPPVRLDLCQTNETSGSYLTADALSLYYTRIEGVGAVEGSIMVSTRATRAVSFTQGTAVPSLAGMQVGYPSLSPDELTLYFEGLNPMAALFYATRPSKSDEFGPAILLAELYVDGEADPEISRDGRELLFTSARNNPGGDSDIWHVTRDCN